MLLKILVEGQTEGNFVKRILKPHLEQYGYTVLHIVNPTSETQRGGLSHYEQFKKNILSLCKSTPCLITTMIDFYQLPKDFPGQQDMKSTLRPIQKVQYLEERLKQDLNIQHPHYFIPYIQLHEFEAILFSDIHVIDSVMRIDCGSTLDKLQSILDDYGEPENINTDAGPSTKLEKITDTKFQKTVHGINIAENIPLDHMRDKCPHFDQWLKQIEGFIE